MNVNIKGNLIMNLLKKEVEEKLQTVESKEDIERLQKLINKYKEKYLYDLDLYAMEITLFLIQNNLKKAREIAEIAIQINPYNAEANYNLAIVCEEQEDYIESYRYYLLARYLGFCEKNMKIFNLNINECLERLWKKINSKLDSDKRVEITNCIQRKFEEGIFGLKDGRFYSIINVIGQIYEDPYYNKRFVAWYDNRKRLLLEQKMELNALEEKVELREVELKNELKIDRAESILLPIASPSPNNIYKVKYEDKIYNITQIVENHFNYYRLPGKVSISTEKEVYFGKPILLKQDPKNKKLVLTIFVDGLAWKVLKNDKIKSLMPNTAKFFSKGVICSNAFATADWTYPSLATYATGLDMTHHMMIRSDLFMCLPRDVTLLTEYFKKNGYTTAKIDGDWRSTPVYGYSRGVDRIIYQHQWVGMRLEEVIPDVLEHLEFMKETNQFVYMGIGDLHDVADGIELPASIQSKLSLEERIITEKGVTSVKQDYDENKIKAYCKVITKIDLYLNMIYEYIEKNYKDNEIIVSLFSDHGQGYLIKPEEHFMARGRSNVTLMFRGGDRKGICDEYISTCDYLPIMCKLANISLEKERIDGKLPKYFGGESEREYVIAESIHPGDPYYAGVFTKKGMFCVTSKEVTTFDGRIPIGDFKWENNSLGWNMIDCDGKQLKLEEKEIEKYKNIIIEHMAGNLIYD